MSDLRKPRQPRSKEPHIEIIMRLPSGEKVGIWSPWDSRTTALTYADTVARRTAARRTREGERDK